jgi:hypothetical protein
MVPTEAFTPRSDLTVEQRTLDTVPYIEVLRTSVSDCWLSQRWMDRRRVRFNCGPVEELKWLVRTRYTLYWTDWTDYLMAQSVSITFSVGP